MDLKLKGKVALVTGSGRGIGRSIAMTLGAEGARVAVNDYYLDRAESVAKEMKGTGGEALAIQADITRAEQVEQMVQRILETWGRLHILVNNAGIPAGILEEDSKALMNDFADTSFDSWNRLIQLDFVGTLNCCKAVLPPMMEQNYGKIVSLISDAGRIGEPKQAVYSGVKAGILGFSKALAKEAARYRINVNCVSPSTTTGTYVTELGGLNDPQSAEQKEKWSRFLKVYPLGRALNRLGQPSDLAHTVAFLASDVSEWITGQVLSVNGGYCMVG